jgi:hypothetical protein
MSQYERKHKKTPENYYKDDICMYITGLSFPYPFWSFGNCDFASEIKSHSV